MDEKRNNALDWTEWVSEYGAALLLYARQWVPSHEDAEDAVQEGFVKVWRYKRASGENLAPLLFTAVRQCAIDRTRSLKRRKDREDKAGQEQGPAIALFESGLEDEEKRRTIEEAIARLPETQKEVLIMKIWGNLTFDQIGRSLGISLNTAASRYRYALEGLRKVLGNKTDLRT